MDIGISSSCFYPGNTEKAFEKACKLGAKTAEIFFNCSEEMQKPIISEIKEIKECYCVPIRTIHPYTSFAEPFMLFGGYERRTNEGIDFYKRYFEAAAYLGAEAVVIHGGKPIHQKDELNYFEVFARLCEEGNKFGVLPAHENVYMRAGSDVGFLKRLKHYLGDDFKLVLDIKQSRRCDVDEFELIRLFGKDIIQLHISDYDKSKDCIPPGEGKYDFKKLFEALKNNEYDKSALIELYAWSWENTSQIEKSVEYLEKIG
ncbi:MAG: sugar phosphate isomerase/epimerase [Clostridia bacterium]|nr:sugar phosphate isomerase/epimerase [Clostridia bacterium]